MIVLGMLVQNTELAESSDYIEASFPYNQADLNTDDVNIINKTSRRYWFTNGRHYIYSLQSSSYLVSG